MGAAGAVEPPHHHQGAAPAIAGAGPRLSGGRRGLLARLRGRCVDPVAMGGECRPARRAHAHGPSVLRDRPAHGKGGTGQPHRVPAVRHPVATGRRAGHDARAYESRDPRAAAGQSAAGAGPRRAGAGLGRTGGGGRVRWRLSGTRRRPDAIRPRPPARCAEKRSPAALRSTAARNRRRSAAIPPPAARAVPNPASRARG